MDSAVPERQVRGRAGNNWNRGIASRTPGMNILKCARTVSVTALLATALVRPAAAQSANALLRDTNSQDVGTVSLLQTPAGVLLKLSLKGMPPGEHAVHIHAVGKCELPSFDSSGPHFNPGNTHHGIMAGPRPSRGQPKPPSPPQPPWKRTSSMRQ